MLTELFFLKCTSTIYITRDLLRLNVGRNSLSEIPKGSLEILKNLNHLDLSFNKIRDVKEKNFEGENFVFLADYLYQLCLAGMEKLDKLDLNHNKIEKLVDYGFEGLPKLTSLSLDYNKISLLEPKAFSGLDGESGAEI